MKHFLRVLCAFLLVSLMSAAVAQDVQLGAGDVLKIAVYGNPDLSLEVRVSEAGNITYPLIGDVAVAGLSTAAAERKISGLLESGGFIRNPQVNINVALMQSQLVSVLGQVNKPGRYPIDGKRSLTDILALAGGVNADASDDITLIRNRNGNSTKQLIDLPAIMRDDASKNPELIAGDVLYVERAPRFYIYGEIQRPGSYKLERDMIVLQALSIGGGLTNRGTERGVRIKRRDAKGVLQIIQVNHDDKILADDIVFVKESFF